MRKLSMRCLRLTTHGLLSLALAAGVVWACGESKPTPQVGSNSNWLQVCEETVECGGELACHCGACMTECVSDAECRDLPGARCAPIEAALSAACAGDLPSRVCLPTCVPGACPGQMPCVDASCAPLKVPDTEFCAPVAERTPADRAREDELLAALVELRAAGGVVCGDAAASLPAPAVHLESRLWCAARVLASDIAVHGELSLVDSLGRRTQERMQLAGYDNRAWGESMAFAGGAARALELMLEDDDSCVRLSAGDLLDVGVGVDGNVAIITLGRE